MNASESANTTHAKVCILTNYQKRTNQQRCLLPLNIVHGMTWNILVLLLKNYVCRLGKKGWLGLQINMSRSLNTVISKVVTVSGYLYCFPGMAHIFIQMVTLYLRKTLSFRVKLESKLTMNNLPLPFVLDIFLTQL